MFVHFNRSTNVAHLMHEGEVYRLTAGGFVALLSNVATTVNMVNPDKIWVSGCETEIALESLRSLVYAEVIPDDGDWYYDRAAERWAADG